MGRGDHDCQKSLRGIDTAIFIPRVILFLTLAHLWWFGGWGFGVWVLIGLLGLGFQLMGLWGLCYGVFWVVWGWGSLYLGVSVVVLFIVKDRQHTYIYMYIYFYTFIGIHNHPKTMCFIMCTTEERNTI